MPKNEFDFSKHIKVPDEWIEKALAIPSSAPAQQHIRMSRRLVAAASVVLVLGLSIGLYFSFRNISVPPAVAPAPAAASTPTEPTLSPVVIVTVTPTVSAPTDLPPTDAQVTFPTLTPTQIPTLPQPTSLTEHPDEVTPSLPAAEPTEQPTQPAVQPTEANITSQTVYPTDEADADPDDVAYTEICHPLFVAPDPDEPYPLSVWEDLDDVYCCICDSSGRVVGDPDLYSADHRAVQVVSNDSVTLNYTAAIPRPDQSAAIASRRFTYRFYESDGTIIAAGQFTL